MITTIKAESIKLRKTPLEFLIPDKLCRTSLRLSAIIIFVWIEKFIFEGSVARSRMNIIPMEIIKIKIAKWRKLIEAILIRTG